MIVIAEFDPLRDDGLAYAEKLFQAGVTIQKKVYPTIHGFVSFADRLDIGKRAIKDIAFYLRTVFCTKTESLMACSSSSTLLP